MPTKDSTRWIKENSRWSEEDLVTITVPREYLIQLRETLRDHKKLGDKLGWPSWMAGLCGWKLDSILVYLNVKLRKKPLAKLDNNL
jgi:hypothetical protein